MVGSMHGEKTNRPPEEEALDRAMNRIDPILQASLVREQHRRRWKFLLWGGLIMLMLTGMLLFALAMPGPQNGGADGPDDEQAASSSESGGRSASQKIADGEKASDLMRAGWKVIGSDPGQAEEKFKEGVSLDSQSDNLWNGLGWSQFYQQKFKESAKSFRQCLELNSDHPAGLNGAGQAFLMLRDYEKAESYFVRGSDDTVPSLFGLARLQLLNGKYDAAKETIKKLNVLETGDLDKSLVKEMYMAARKKRLSKALKTKIEPPPVATIEPAQNGNANALNAKGWKMFQQGKNRAAELAFREALALKSNHPGAKNGLAFALLNQGKHKEAKPMFEAAVKKDPTAVGSVNGLARCFEMSGQHDEAVKMWQTVDEEDGEVTACTWGIARTLVQLEKWDDALPYWKRIKKDAPNDRSVDAMIKKCRDNG